MKAATRHKMISAGLAAMTASRVDRLLAPLAAGPGVALVFHRIAEPAPKGAFAPNAALAITPEAFEAAIATIAKAGLAIIPADTVRGRLQASKDPGRRSGQRFAVITFDDGYKDTLEVAAPILAKAGAPWTLFAAPAFLAGHGRAWWLELEACLHVLDEVEAMGRDGGVHLLPTRDPAQKARAYAILREAFVAAPRQARESELRHLCKLAKVDPGALTKANFATAREVAEVIRSHDVTLGSHTLHHPVLARCNDKAAQDEIAGSKRHLEKTFGVQVRHLAYPHGDAGSLGPREHILARKAGYEHAWTTDARHLRHRDLDTPHALPRISVNGLHHSPATLRAMLGGAPFLFQEFGRQAGRRRSNEPPQPAFEVDGRAEPDEKSSDEVASIASSKPRNAAS